MRHHFDHPALVLALLPALTLAQQSPPVETEVPLPKPKLELPVLRFDVIDIPEIGRVASVAGRIERLTRTGWVDIAPGERIEDGARLQINANSDFAIRFSSAQDLRFRAVPTVRRVAFRVAVPR